MSCYGNHITENFWQHFVMQLNPNPWLMFSSRAHIIDCYLLVSCVTHSTSVVSGMILHTSSKVILNIWFFIPSSYCFFILRDEYLLVFYFHCPKKLITVCSFSLVRASKWAAILIWFADVVLQQCLLCLCVQLRNERRYNISVIQLSAAQFMLLVSF